MSRRIVKPKLAIPSRSRIFYILQKPAARMRGAEPRRPQRPPPTMACDRSRSNSAVRSDFQSDPTVFRRGTVYPSPVGLHQAGACSPGLCWASHVGTRSSLTAGGDGELLERIALESRIAAPLLKTLMPAYKSMAIWQSSSAPIDPGRSAG